MALLLLSAASLLSFVISCFFFQMSTVSGIDLFNLDDKTGAVWLHSSSNITMEERIEMAHARNLNAVSDPDEVMSMLDMRLKKSLSKRRKLGYYSSNVMPNPIDDCWRHNPNWSNNRMDLADCAIGFGRHAMGGKNGRLYVVTDPNDYDPVTPCRGTLRHAVIQPYPLWIIFKNDMVITLKQELIFNSFKTIDGRGANVEIAHGGCITLQFVSNIIIHGISIHHCIPTGNAMVRSSPTHYGYRTLADGDAISIFTSSNIWIDHVTLAHCSDGLIDAVMGSTAISITNNYFTDHNEVMLMGHSDSYYKDSAMQVTIAYNHFGEKLIQRMPRCRFGNFHVVNNYYEHWLMYALGGSSHPTINSQGNQYVAQNYAFTKEVTKRLYGDGMNWNWSSRGDLLLNGASFLESGQKYSGYSRASSMVAKAACLVPQLVRNAGSLSCLSGSKC